jgi:hypothetical protein
LKLEHKLAVTKAPRKGIRKIPGRQILTNQTRQTHYLITLQNTRQARSGKVHGEGAVAQLGERVVRNDEVAGSIPVGSTITSISETPERLPCLQ